MDNINIFLLVVLVVLVVLSDGPSHTAFVRIRVIISYSITINRLSLQAILVCVCV